ncbi:hypothetical protein D3C85_1926370 [compost metagenome]
MFDDRRMFLLFVDQRFAPTDSEEVAQGLASGETEQWNGHERPQHELRASLQGAGNQQRRHGQH